MSKLKNELEKAISHMPDFDKLKDQIEIKVTAEGLRIELLESATGTFFDLGSPNPNQNGKQLLDLLAGPSLASYRTRFPLKDTRIRSLTAASEITAIGSFRSIVPTPRDA